MRTRHLYLLLVAASGCSTLDGVNVGTTIPIGGLGGIGVNKTIDTTSSQPRQRSENEHSIDCESEEYDKESCPNQKSQNGKESGDS